MAPYSMADAELYYIPENEDVLAFLARQDIAVSAAVAKRLAFISQKAYNNQIGYYQFRQDGVYYKFLIVPKIYQHLANGVEKEKAFLVLLSRYYQLLTQYPAIKKQSVQGNVMDISFRNFQEKASTTIEQFIRHQYEYALGVLDRFFRNHNKTQLKRLSYTSQTIAHKINLKENIVSLDKSRVHQTKKTPEAYSTLALIAAYALGQFKQEKLKHFSHNREALETQVNITLNRIRKRFDLTVRFSFRDRDIITHRITKLFKKNSELREVYQALLIVIGLEHHRGQDDSQQIRKLENMIALFFNPAELYEWIVYDSLKGRYPTAQIQKQGTDEGTSQHYQLISTQGVHFRSSQPDFIVTLDDKVIILDAKWKVLETVTDIGFDDVAKLERDWKIRREQNIGKEMQAGLVYPQVWFDQRQWKHSYSPFIFSVNEVKV